MDRLDVAFNKRWGCALSHEKSSKSPFFHRIIPIYSNPKDFDGTISSLRLKFNGRWGNYVFQLVNMFYLAEKLKCTHLYIHSSDMFPVTTRRLMHGLTIESVRLPTSTRGFELEGVFFDMVDFQDLMCDLTPALRRHLAQKYVKPLLTRHLDPRSDLVGEGDLVIHVRSGDIFQGVDGQGGSEIGGSLYIQPPLSFYTKVAKANVSRGSARAIIVSENSLNPTVFPLTKALEELGYAVTLRLQHDLTSDLACLLAARHAMFANGTIGIAVALLSEYITDAYFFRKDGTGTFFDVDYFLGDFLDKHFIMDNPGSFIKKGEWRNDETQRQLMVNLSEDQLFWERELRIVNVAFKKPARQSSTSTYSQQGESEQAVDGNLDRDFSFHTSLEHFPWWEVDLDGLHRIDQIVVYNRDSLPERAYAMQVFVLGHENQWRMVHDQGGRAFGGRGGKPARITLRGIQARAIRIQIPAYEYLHLRAVEVFGWQ